MVSGGAETAFHVARQFIGNLQPQDAVVKLDFSSAFNCVRRDRMLNVVEAIAFDRYPYIHSTPLLPLCSGVIGPFLQRKKCNRFSERSATG